MPTSFWNDLEHTRYRKTYCERFPNVWSHGDFIEITDEGGVIIHGRSDATLNPRGVRIGTAEIYRQVEQLDEVMESLVIGQTITNKRGTDVRVVLFVRLQNGLVLDNTLRDKIRREIRDNVTPH